MAKTAKLKKKTKSTSIHSRSARRASSPSLNLDKSITSIPAAPARSSVLSVQNEAGISKRRDKGKEPSSRQNLRNKESAKKFIANMEKRDEKLEKIQDVRVRESWDMINKKIGVGENKKRKEKKKKKMKIKSKDSITEDDEDQWEDEGEVEDMEVEVDDSTAVGETVEAGNGEKIEDSTMNVEKQTGYIDEAVLEADKIL